MTFDIDFECTNCGKEFTEHFERMQRVEHNYHNKVEVILCDKDGSYDKFIKIVQCPCCGLTNYLTIKERRPI